jgi:hypothetical protein
VALILDAGVAPGSRNERGRTPLYVAVEAGSEEMVEALLAAGADPNDPGADVDKSMEYGDTLVMRAVDRNNPRILKALLRAKADPNKGNAYGVNGMMSAAMQGRAELVGILYAAGGNVNARDKNGTPVLYSAVQGGDYETVRVLIEDGADTSVNRKLLLDTAKSKSDPRIAALIEKPPAGKRKKAASDKSDYVEASVPMPPPQPTAKSASTGTGKKPLTGKQAYDLTFAAASKWQKDAGLTELSTTSEGPIDSEGRSALGAHFYSPSGKQVFLASLDNGKLTRSRNRATAADGADRGRHDPSPRSACGDRRRGRRQKCSSRGASASAGLVPNRGRALWYFSFSDKETSKNIYDRRRANAGKVEAGGREVRASRSKSRSKV